MIDFAYPLGRKSLAAGSTVKVKPAAKALRWQLGLGPGLPVMGQPRGWGGRRFGAAPPLPG
jgi:hypothetical protein